MKLVMMGILMGQVNEMQLVLEKLMDGIVLEEQPPLLQHELNNEMTDI